MMEDFTHGRLLILSDQKYEIIRPLSERRGRRVILVRNSARDFQTVLKTTRVLPFTEAGRCEPKVQRLCTHENVVPVFHDELFRSNLFIEMEYAESDSLFDILTKRFISVVETVEYLKQILSALSLIHANGIIHRDVGAENIMIFGKAAKLSDFGSALDMVAVKRCPITYTLRTLHQNF